MEEQYRQFYDNVKKLNLEKLDEISAKFIDLSNGKPYCIGTVGSDARLENAHIGGMGVSPLELVILSADGFPKLDELIEIPADIKEEINEDYIESINVNQPYSSRLQRIGLSSPGRTIDFNPLIGDENLYEHRMAKMIEKLQLPGSKGKKMIKLLNQPINMHGEIMMTGTQDRNMREIEHYNLEEGLAYYDTHENNNTSSLSFKQGPNRFIQNIVLKDTLKGMRNGVFTNHDMINFPKDTAARIKYLSEKKPDSTFTEKSIRENVIDNYMFFQNEYQKSQDNFIKGNTVSEFDVKEVKERLNYLKNKIWLNK